MLILSTLVKRGVSGVPWGARSTILTNDQDCESPQSVYENNPLFTVYSMTQPLHLHTSAYALSFRQEPCFQAWCP